MKLSRMDFQAFLEKIESAFGNKKYSKEQMEALYKRLAYFSKPAWVEAVEEIICNEKFLPKGNELTQHLKAAEAKLGNSRESLTSQREKKIKNFITGEKCKWCKSEGLVFTTKRVGNLDASFLFACFCEAGQIAKQTDGRGYSIWDPEKHGLRGFSLESEYDLPYRGMSASDDAKANEFADLVP